MATLLHAYYHKNQPPSQEKIQNRYIIFHEQRTPQTCIPLLFLFQLVVPVFAWTFVSGRCEWENHLKAKYDSISVSWEFLHGMRQRLLGTGTWGTIGYSYHCLALLQNGWWFLQSYIYEFPFQLTSILYSVYSTWEHKMRIFIISEESQTAGWML